MNQPSQCIRPELAILSNVMIFTSNIPPPPQEPSANASPRTAPHQPLTTKSIEISSQVVFSSLSAAWALQNRAALIATLRSVLALTKNDELVISAIHAGSATRGLKQARGGARTLQQSGGGARIEFTVGLSEPTRAVERRGKLASFAAGSSALLQQFSAQLDTELQARGQAPVAVPVSAMTFSEPQIFSKKQNSGQMLSVSVSGGQLVFQTRPEEEPVSGKTSSEKLPFLVLVGIVVLAAFIGLLAWQKGKAKGKAGHVRKQGGEPDMYASKVAGLGEDNIEAEQWQQ